MRFKRYVVVGVCFVSCMNCLALSDGQTKNKSKKTSKKTADSCRLDKNDCYNHSRFQVGPYLNKDRLFDGSELVVTTPSIREARALLQKQQKLLADCAKLGMPAPKFPRITLSGLIEAQYMYQNPYKAGDYTRFTLDNAELDLYLQATNWLSAYVAIDYDPTNKDREIFMNRGFITLGNLDKSPFYISAGKMFAPFGRYTSSMVTPPLTRSLARTHVNTVEIGYQQPGQNALNAEIYFYQGITHYTSNQQSHHLEYGFDTSYKFKSAEVGAGIISNLADSAGIQGNLFNAAGTFLQHRVPALDLYGSYNINKFTVLAEYISALRHFAKQNFAYEGKGARPSALNTEIAYAIKSFNRPSSIGIGYSQTSQAVAIGLPKQSYRVVYNINIIRDTNLAIEYHHDVNYSVAEGVDTGADTNQLGKSANAVTAQVDYYF